jgi:hypothetical protein
MRTMILAAVAAVGLSLSSVAPAKAQYWARQYYYAPNTAYTFSYATPYSSYYNPYTTGYYPYTSGYYSNPYGYNPYVSGYTAPTQYYTWDWYNPYTNQYRTWRWFRRY